MAKIIRREWTSKGPVGKRVRHVAFGYTLASHGNRERKVSSAWTCEEDALNALSARQQQIRAGQTDRPTDVTFGHVVERYLKFKNDHGTRSLGGRVSWVRRKLSGSCWPVRSPATSIW